VKRIVAVTDNVVGADKAVEFVSCSKHSVPAVARAFGFVGCYPYFPLAEIVEMLGTCFYERYRDLLPG
jgi:hypothetical protein